MKISASSFAMTTLLCICMTGCATMSDVMKSKDEGMVQTYQIKSDQAWEVAMTVLRWEGCETIEEHRLSGYMLTTTSEEGFATNGCLIGVWVEPVNESSTKITVVTKRRRQLNLATGLTETTFQRRYAQAVEIVKKGRQLPMEPPIDTGD